MTASSFTTFQSKTLKTSSAQSENRCQSPDGGPRIAQIIVMGYRLATSAAAPARTGMGVDEVADDVRARRPQSFGRSRRECLRDQPALSMVCGTVEAQQPLDRDVPQLAGRDAPRGEGEP